MRKGMIICCTVLVLLTLNGSLAASAMTESTGGLWKKADAIADASSTYLPGVRRITYQETDGKGNIVYADQAVALIESSHNGRYLQVREFGDEEIFSLIDRYSDGIVMTPFENNLKELDYEYSDITEQVDGKTCDVFTFEMAYDASLPYYDPNYEASGNILNWDSDDEDFAGTIGGSIWIDKLSGAPVKMIVNYLFEDNTQQGTLKLNQTVYFSYTNGIVTPATIRTTGTLSIQAGQKGQLSVKDFVIEEEQHSFWQNEKFARGTTVL